MMLSFFGELLFFVGYVSMVGPPRALSLRRREQFGAGELSGLPLYAIVIIEVMLRGGILLLLAVGVEYLLGKRLVTLYGLDGFFGILLVAGAVHTAAYYLLAVTATRRFGAVAGRLYRMIRNLVYSVIGATVLCIVPLIWQHAQQIEPYSGTLVRDTFVAALAVLGCAGLIEAILRHRQPLGLDLPRQPVAPRAVKRPTDGPPSRSESPAGTPG